MPSSGREPLPQQAGGRPARRVGDHVDPLRRHVLGPQPEDRQRVVHPPEPPLAPVGIHRFPVDHVAQPVLPAPGVAVLDGLLPLRGQQRRHVADGQHDVHLGRLERAHRRGGLLGVGRGEQFVRDDRRLPWLPGLAGEDLPFAGPGPRRVGGQLLDAAQVLAGPEMVLRVVPGQHDALGGQFGTVAPQHLLDKGRAGLGLPDVQEDPGLSGTQRCQLRPPRGFWVMVRLTRQDGLLPRPAGRISTQAIVGEGSPNAVREYLRTNLHTADKPPMLYKRASGPLALVPLPAARIS